MRKLLALLALLLVGLAGCGKSQPTTQPAKPPALSPATCQLVVPECTSITPEGAKAAKPPVSLPPASVSEKHIDDSGLALVERFENVPKAWYCVEYDPYGHTYDIGFGEAFISPSRPCESFAQAQSNLRYQIEANYEWAIRALGRPFNQHQWDALCSFTYNLGAGIWSDGLRSAIQSFNPYPMLGYDHAGGVVLPGLAERRRLEVDLFLRSERPPKPPETPAQHRAKLQRELSAAVARRAAIRGGINHYRVLIRRHQCTLDRRGHSHATPHTHHQWALCRGWVATGNQLHAEGNNVNATIRQLQRALR